MDRVNAIWKTLGMAMLGVCLAGAIALSVAGAIAQADEAPTVVFPMPSAVTNDTRVRLGGTPIMAPLNQALKQEFEAQFPGTAVEVEAEPDTQAALEALQSGAVDLAGIGRPLTEAERAEGLQEVPVSLDKIAILVGKANPFKGSLTMAQLAQIFRGEITDWAQLGRAPGTIQLVDRPMTSETRLALARYGIVPESAIPATVTHRILENDDTAELVEQLGRDGLGYAIAHQIRQNPQVKPVKIAILQTTLPGDALYPYAQPRSYAYKDETNPAIRAFLGFTATEAGRAALATARREESTQLAQQVAQTREPDGGGAIALPPSPVATSPELSLPRLPTIPAWLRIVLALIPLGGLLWGLQQRRRSRRKPITPVTVRRKPRTPAPDEAEPNILDAWIEDVPNDTLQDSTPPVADLVEGSATDLESSVEDLDDLDDVDPVVDPITEETASAVVDGEASSVDSSAIDPSTDEVDPSLDEAADLTLVEVADVTGAMTVALTESEGEDLGEAGAAIAVDADEVVSPAGNDLVDGDEWLGDRTPEPEVPESTVPEAIDDLGEEVTQSPSIDPATVPPIYPDVSEIDISEVDISEEDADVSEVDVSEEDADQVGQAVGSAATLTDDSEVSDSLDEPAARLDPLAEEGTATVSAAAVGVEVERQQIPDTVAEDEADGLSLLGRDPQARDPQVIEATLQRLLAPVLVQEGETAARYLAAYRVLAGALCQALLKGSLSQLDATDPPRRFVAELTTEYPPGVSLNQALLNQGLFQNAQQALHDIGLDLPTLLAAEPESGMGRNPLGGLLLGYLEALATQGVPAMGYGLRYDLEESDQDIQDGWPLEVINPSQWQIAATDWEISRPDRTVQVPLGGHTESWEDEGGYFWVRWLPAVVLEGHCYDRPIPGYGSAGVSLWRLWRAAGGDARYNQLYPTGIDIDAEVRLGQQFFLVSCTIQDLLRQHQATGKAWEALPQGLVLQLNDQATLLAIAELMRLLIDDHHLPWETAWDVTRATLRYTSHSLIPETLENCWSVELFRQVLPRHLEIIFEINARFLAEVRSQSTDESHLSRLSLIAEALADGEVQRVRLTHLACLGTAAINGVSALQTQLLQERILPDFYRRTPELFSTQSNGVSPRRWVQLANPALSDLIHQAIGTAWLHDPDAWSLLEPYADDASFREAWQQVKQGAKIRLAALITERLGIRVNPSALFDGHLSTVHEYKRYALNILHILRLYLLLKDDPSLDLLPRVFLFSGKAAAGDPRAKRLIKLIHLVADRVNGDGWVGDRLKVIFLPNFSQSLADHLYPALDLSEHLSLAGTEAADTGMVTAAFNGSLLLGTPDGSHLEVREAIGAENSFLFGMTEAEVSALLESGYDPAVYDASHPNLKAVIDFLTSPSLGPDAPVAMPFLVQTLLTNDPYRVLADYEAYVAAQQQVAQAFETPAIWHARAIRAWARLGNFSSDRAIQRYAQNIWNINADPNHLRQCIAPPSG